MLLHLLRWFVEAVICVVAIEVFAHFFNVDVPSRMALVLLLALGFSQIELWAKVSRLMDDSTDKTNHVVDTVTVLRERFDGFGKQFSALSLLASTQLTSKMESGASPYLANLLTEAVTRVDHIARGKIVLENERPEYAWTKHMEHLRVAPTGTEFLATCVIPKTDSGIVSVFENERFNEYCRLSYDFATSGRLGRMKKLFVADEIRQAMHPDVLKHLVEIQQRAHRSEGKLEARVMVLSEVRKKEKIHPPRDFMIWGNDLLVISLMEEVHLLNGLEYNTDHHDIQEMIAHFERLFDLADPVEQWTRRDTRALAL